MKTINREIPRGATKLKILLTAGILSFGSLSIQAQSERYLALADSADRCISREEWSKAEDALTAALKLEPANASNSMLLSNLGVVRTRRGNINGALEAFDVALAMAPESKSVRINRARTLLESHDDNGAIDDLNAVLALDSLQEWSLRTRGLLLLSQRRYEEGLRDITLHQKHYPADADLLAAGAACEAARGNNKEAIEWYDRSIETKQTADSWFARTLLKIQEGRLGEADDDIRRAIAIYPDTGDLYLLRAMLKKMNHLLSESEEDRKLAMRKGASATLATALLDDKEERERGSRR